MIRRLRTPLLALLLVLAGVGSAAAYHYAVTGRLDLGLSLEEAVTTSLSGVNATVSPSVKLNLTYVGGTSDGQINAKWCRTDSVTADGADTFDLRGGLTNEFGSSVVFAEIEALGIRAHSNNVDDLYMGGGTVANRWTTFLLDSSKVALKPGYMMAFGGQGKGYGVTANTGDTLVIRNSADSSVLRYDICIAGRSS